MIPSERIKEIYFQERDDEDTEITDLHRCIYSIMKYLDEQYLGKQYANS